MLRVMKFDLIDVNDVDNLSFITAYAGVMTHWSGEYEVRLTQFKSLRSMVLASYMCSVFSER